MKKFKKLVPAFLALVVSLVSMTSATFAWFSMNREVSASSLKITAKADTTYLLINTNGAAASGDTSTTYVNGSATLYPAHYVGFDATEKTKWFYAEGTSRTDGTAVASTQVDFTETSDSDVFAERVLKNTVYLTLAAGSKATNRLAITLEASALTDNIGEATKAEIIIGGNHIGTVSKASNTIAAFAQDINDSSAVAIDIYVYFDGADSDITTEEFENGNLTTATDIKLVFEVSNE